VGRAVRGCLDAIHVPMSMPVEDAGVYCTNGIVTQLSWYTRGLTGFFNGSNLPTGLQYGFFQYNRFTDNPILNSLPATLQYLSLHDNEFSGTPDLSSLPAGLAGCFCFFLFYIIESLFVFQHFCVFESQ